MSRGRGLEFQQLPRPGAAERRVGDRPIPEWVKNMETAGAERRIFMSIGPNEVESRLWADFCREFK